MGNRLIDDGDQRFQALHSSEHPIADYKYGTPVIAISW